MCSGRGDWALPQPGFPIRRSTDRSLIGSSPWLIAAIHVLHRHLAPRHPPLALCSLKSHTPRAFEGTEREGDTRVYLKTLVLAMQFSRTEPRPRGLEGCSARPAGAELNGGSARAAQRTRHLVCGVAPSKQSSETRSSRRPVMPASARPPRRVRRGRLAGVPGPEATPRRPSSQ